MLDREARDAEDRRHRRVHVGRRPAAVACEQRRAPESRQGLADLGLGHRQQQGGAVRGQLDERTARSHRQQQAELGVTVQPHDQLRHDVRREPLDEHLAATATTTNSVTSAAAATAATATITVVTATAVNAAAQRQQRPRRFPDLAGIAQPQPHRAVLGLVRDAQRLHRNGAAERGGDGHRLVLAVRHRAGRDRDAERGEPRLRLRLVEQHRFAREAFIGEEWCAGTMPGWRRITGRRPRQAPPGGKQNAGPMPGLRVIVCRSRQTSTSKKRSAGRRAPRLADRRRALDRGERLPHPAERGDAALHQLCRRLLRQVLPQGGRDDPLGPGRLHGPLERMGRRPPVRVVAAVGAREVEHQHGRVEPGPREGAERPRQRGLVAPTEGVVVERVRDRDQRMHRRPDRRGVLRRRIGERHPGPLGGVGEQARLPARAAHRAEARTAERAVYVEQLQRFEELRDAVHAGEPEPAQERLRTRVGPGHGRGMAQGRGPSPLRAPGLHDHHRDRARAGLAGQGLEPRHRVEPLDVQPDGAHPPVFEKGRGEARDPKLGLVADGDHVGDGERAPLHGHADRDVRGLGHDGDPAPVLAEPPSAVLVRPQRCAVEEVDEPVAVRADDRHLPRRLDQGALQRPAVARFEEA